MAQSITRLSGVNSLSGTLPSSVIANSTLDNITALPSAVPTGKPILLSTATASSSASIEFTSGIDSTYDIYQFEFINCHPATDSVSFHFQSSTDGGSNYNVTTTSTTFNGAHSEDDTTVASLFYVTGTDQAQGTGYQFINGGIGNDNDQSVSGEMQIFNPSSTTFVKHYIIRSQGLVASDQSVDFYTAGYFNTTSAINAISFKFSSGNIDSGDIKLYGIS